MKETSTRLESIWEFQVIATTLKAVNKDLKEVAEKEMYLKSMHVMGETILLLVGRPLTEVEIVRKRIK